MRLSLAHPYVNASHTFLTLLPRTIWHIIPPHMPSKVCPGIFYRIDCSFFALHLFNYIVNPVIYAVRMRKFGKAARKLVSTKTLDLNAGPTHITSYITSTYSRNTCWRKNIGNERSLGKKTLTSLLRSCCHWISFVILINVTKIWMTKPRRGKESRERGVDLVVFVGPGVGHFCSPMGEDILIFRRPTCSGINKILRYQSNSTTSFIFKTENNVTLKTCSSVWFSRGLLLEGYKILIM